MIGLDSNRLEKTIPTELGQLIQLTELILGKISMYIFKSPFHEVLASKDMANFFRCISFAICTDAKDNNKFTGQIPTSFGSLQKLEYLTFCK